MLLFDWLFALNIKTCYLSTSNNWKSSWSCFFLSIILYASIN